MYSMDREAAKMKVDVFISKLSLSITASTSSSRCNSTELVGLE